MNIEFLISDVNVVGKICVYKMQVKIVETDCDSLVLHTVCGAMDIQHV